MNLRTLLIDPHLITGNYIGPNLGLGYLVRAIEDYTSVGIDQFSDVRISSCDTLDEFSDFERDFLDRIVRRVAAEDYDVVGITGTCNVYYRMVAIARAVKEVSPRTKVMYGGPHVTLMHQYAPYRSQIFSDAPIDYCVIGEAELTAPELFQAFKTGWDTAGIPGVLQMAGGEPTMRAARPAMDLAALRYPAWEAFALQNYGPIINVQASRGCKYNCSFCDERYLWRNALRTRPVLEVVSEMAWDHDVFGYRFFRFSDSSLTSHPDLASLCRILSKRVADVTWSAFARLNEVTPSLLSDMRTAGCKILFFGIESGDATILKKARKGLTPVQIRDRVKAVQDSGIMTVGSFIIGLPGETRQQALDTIAFAQELNMDVYSWHVFAAPVSMIVASDGTQLPKGLDVSWVTFKADVPHHLTAQAFAEAPQILLDRHTIPEILKWSGGEQVGLAELRIPYSELTYHDAYELIGLAMKETKPTDDMDELRILAGE
jgi:radical SAM superfamily enzyme YgiQ (UPF0313 family)